MPITHENPFEHLGRTVTLAQLSRETGLSAGCLQSRYGRGDRDRKLVRRSKFVGNLAPMSLEPRDNSHERLVQRWVESVFT